jgi:hypothetical protein
MRGYTLMSQAAAIWTAVTGQLIADNRPLPSTGNEVMGGGYKYDATTIRNFLRGVATRLSTDTPPLTFQWTKLDVDTCLKDSVATLCGYIASATN